VFNGALQLNKDFIEPSPSFLTLCVFVHIRNTFIIFLFLVFQLLCLILFITYLEPSDAQFENYWCAVYVCGMFFMGLCVEEKFGLYFFSMWNVLVVMNWDR
jgi:hypothetical protein